MEPGVAGWVAGFWQADGSIYLNRVREDRVLLRITASQHEEEPILWLHKTFGGQMSARPEGTGIRYEWRLNSQPKVQDFIRLIEPYVRSTVRRKKLLVALALSEAIVAGSPTTALVEEFRAIKAA